MSKRLVEELKTTLTQDFTLASDSNYNVSRMRPFIFIYNMPAGTFTLTVKQNSETVATATFTSASLKSDIGTSDDYFYIWANLTPTPTSGTVTDTLSLKPGTVTFELSSSGYTFIDLSSPWIGWVKEHEFAITTDYVSISDSQKPLSLKLLTYEAPELL